MAVFHLQDKSVGENDPVHQPARAARHIQSLLIHVGTDLHIPVQGIVLEPLDGHSVPLPDNGYNGVLLGVQGQSKNHQYEKAPEPVMDECFFMA